jgi:hypothetical protein
MVRSWLPGSWSLELRYLDCKQLKTDLGNFRLLVPVGVGLPCLQYF